jgi:hypothetical protein
LGHYLARPKTSAPERICSPGIRLCFSSFRHQTATRCSAASIEFSLVDRSKFTRTSLTASLIEKPGLAPVFNTKVISECIRWVPFWILNLAGFSRIERAVGEQAALRQLVGGPIDARHGVCGIEGRLFNFSEIIFRNCEPTRFCRPWSAGRRDVMRPWSRKVY